MKTQATVDFLTITPSIATEWLAQRWHDQRKVRTGHVKRLAADMAEGRFRISPDALLRVKGKLANGQHRLEAVVMSRTQQTFLVMESHDEELYKVIDAGLKRSVADGLGVIAFAKSMPSIARWVQAYDNEQISKSARSGAEAGRGGHSKVMPSQTQLIDYCLAHEELLSEAASFVTSLYSQTKLLPLSIGGALYVISHAHLGHVGSTKLFLQEVYLGGGQSAAGDLRNRLIANRGSKARLPAGYIFGLAIKALKAHLQGVRPGSLKWADHEEFPSL